MPCLYFRLNRGNVKFLSAGTGNVWYRVILPSSSDDYTVDYAQLPTGDIKLGIEIAEWYQGRVLVETGLVAAMPLSAQITTGNVELFSPPSVVSVRCMAANVVVDGLGETHEGTSSFEIDTGNIEVRDVDNLLVYLEVETGRVEHSDDWKAVEPNVWKGAGLKGTFQRGLASRNKLDMKMKVGNIILR